MIGFVEATLQSDYILQRRKRPTIFRSLIDSFLQNSRSNSISSQNKSYIIACVFCFTIRTSPARPAPIHLFVLAALPTLVCFHLSYVRSVIAQLFYSECGKCKKTRLSYIFCVFALRKKPDITLHRRCVATIARGAASPVTLFISVCQTAGIRLISSEFVIRRPNGVALLRFILSMRRERVACLNIYHLAEKLLEEIPLSAVGTDSRIRREDIALFLMSPERDRITPSAFATRSARILASRCESDSKDLYR